MARRRSDVASEANPAMTSNRSLKLLTLAAAALTAGALASRSAQALTGDVMLVDPINVPQALSYNSASSGSSTPTQITLSFSPTTRSAYTQAAPLDLPCDLTWLATGMAFRNVSASGVYAEIGGSLYVNGDERRPLTNVYGQTEPYATLSPLVAPNAMSAGGFIFVAPPPLYDFLPTQLPANVPLKIRMLVRAYNDTAYDSSRGGYFVSARVPEPIVWNNTYFVWIRRSCPSP